jgi:hypothetical protein
VDDVLNQEITILDFKVGESKFKTPQYATIQFKLEEKSYIMFSGSNVLISQLEKYRDQIPFLTKIKKINKYYTLS